MLARDKTSMSISDVLGLSIFCRKIEWTRAFREEIDERAVYVPPDSAFPLRFLIMRVPLPICSLTWRVIFFRVHV